MRSPTRSLLLGLAVPAAATAAVWWVRPGVVENAVRSPVAWLVAGGVLAASVGVRAGALRLGAGPRVAQVLTTGLVLALVAVLLAPSFRQRTLVEELPDELSVAVAATPSPVPSAAAPTVVPAAPAAPAVDRRGALEGIGHTARGTVRLRSARDASYVVFDDVDIEGSVGPSVHLVPTGQRRPGGKGLRLGDLKAERGTFSYRVPAGVDLARSWSVLVWCDPYDTPIAAADVR